MILTSQQRQLLTALNVPVYRPRNIEHAPTPAAEPAPVAVGEDASDRSVTTFPPLVLAGVAAEQLSGRAWRGVLTTLNLAASDVRLVDDVHPCVWRVTDDVGALMQDGSQLVSRALHHLSAAEKRQLWQILQGWLVHDD